MPCHVRAASPSRKRRFPSLTLSPPKIVAVFDLSDDTERQARSVIEHTHAGRWPLFRCYAMRRIGSVVHEVVRWHPTRRACPLVYSVVTWDLTTVGWLGLRWRYYPTLDAAREAFAAAVGNVPPTSAAAPAAACAAV